MRELATQL